jgi:hypothetical protein
MAGGTEGGSRREREGVWNEWRESALVRKREGVRAREKETGRGREGEREEDGSEFVKNYSFRCAVQPQGQEAQAVLPQRANDIRVGAGPRRGSSTSPLPPPISTFARS